MPILRGFESRFVIARPGMSGPVGRELSADHLVLPALLILPATLIETPETVRHKHVFKIDKELIDTSIQHSPWKYPQQFLRCVL